MRPRVRTTTASGAVDADEVARDGLTRLVTLPGVARAGLALTEGGGRRLRFTAVARPAVAPEAGEPTAPADVSWCHIDAYDDVPLTAVVRTGDDVLGDLDALEPRFAGVVGTQRAAGTVAMAAVPLVDHGPPLGGLILFYDAPQPFDDAQRAELTRYAVGLAGRLRRGQAAEPRRAEVQALPSGPQVHAVRLGVTADPRAVGETRRALRRELTAWGVDDDAVDTVVLCLSELVTNAVLHTRADSEVRAVLDDGVLTVSVIDQGAAVRRDEEDVADDPLRVHGRGLQLVEALADRWGSELDEVGTTVWFVLERALAEAG